MVASPENFPLLKELLADQQRLQTPAVRAAEAFEQSAFDREGKVFSDLIPLSAPRPGEQYAFEVALDSCSGCKACVSACHSLNGLDDTETWRDVGLVIGGPERHPIQQTVTSACHHCADPACLNGCPVLAYEKDPVTGIVRHLDDQCIGCQYCILKCPYDAPKYNARLGIVRKCDMCQSRLAEGEAPACVQACPTHAIRIVTVRTKIEATVALGSELSASSPEDVSTGAGALAEVPTSIRTSAPDATTKFFLSAAPDPAYTQPTTRYLSRRTNSISLTAADAAVLRVQPAHWPLVLMLTLLPLGVGCQIVATLGTAAAWPSSPDSHVTYHVTCAAWLAGALGLAASVFHLGQPRRAWRIFLGWRKSWLSREAMVFGAWFGVATLSLVEPSFVAPAAGVGVVGLLCSVMIYVDTHRRFWRFAQTAPRFMGAALTLGAAAGFALGFTPLFCAVLLATATVAKLGFEARAFRPLDDSDEETPANPALNTARILTGPLRTIAVGRVFGALLAGLLLPALVWAGELPRSASWSVLAAVFLAELTERYLFFRAVDAPKMPGFPANERRRR